MPLFDSRAVAAVMVGLLVILAVAVAADALCAAVFPEAALRVFGREHVVSVRCDQAQH